MVSTPVPASPPFSFIGGHLALDLTNTVDWHAAESRVDRLQRYSDFLAWARQAAIVSAAEARELAEAAGAHPKRARAALSTVRRTREAIYQVFAATAASHAPDARSLTAMSAGVREAASHGRLRWASQARWAWEDPHDMLRPLWAVIWTASELLTSAEVGRVRQCQSDDGCGWLFVDRSKNGARRWCSMAVCGNRAKARRHYERTRATRSGPPQE